MNGEPLKGDQIDLGLQRIALLWRTDSRVETSQTVKRLV